MLLELSLLSHRKKNTDIFSWCKLPQLRFQFKSSSREVFQLLFIIFESRPLFCLPQPRQKGFSLGALYQQDDLPHPRAPVRVADGGWCRGKYSKVAGEEKGPLQVLLQIKCERVKGDDVKMKLLKEDEKNRREIKDTLNLGRNHFLEIKFKTI